MKFTYILLCLLNIANGLQQPRPYVPDIHKRNLMNNVLLSTAGLSCGPMAGVFLYYFMPSIDNNSDDGTIALDKDGNEIIIDNWIKSHKPNSRNLVQGINGDPYYLIRTNDNIETFALNAIYTHLGCVVPWNEAEQKFICPCHGSKGNVIRGPAPRSLKQADVFIENSGKIKLKLNNI